jgi:hypothetical protein
MTPVVRALAASLVLVFAILAAAHVFWAAGGRIGGGTAIPRAGGRVLFTPSPLGTLAVAAALLAAAALVAATVGWIRSPVPAWLLRAATTGLGAIFLLRAVGDFRYVGFFKTLGEDPFRTWDTWLFSPLCLGIGLAALVVALRRA